VALGEVAGEFVQVVEDWTVLKFQAWSMSPPKLRWELSWVKGDIVQILVALCVDISNACVYCE